MDLQEELKQNVKQWSASPRRVIVDALFVLFSLASLYNGLVGVQCEITQPGYLPCEFVRLLYFAFGIICILFLTSEFKEGRLKPVVGKFLGAEPVGKRSSITDLDIDMSGSTIRETQDAIEVITPNEEKEIKPERNE